MKLYRLFKQTMLVLAIGSVVFLTNCDLFSEEDPVDAPVAGFSFEVNNETGVVSFVNESTGEGNEYSWDFGDGTSSTEFSPDKTYTESDDYSVTLTATNEGGSDSDTQTVTVALEQEVVDTEAPVITLVGDAVEEVLLGETYDDDGATATDNVDGDLTASIVVGGDVVDTQVSGTYVITYDVSDAAGNAAEQVTRTVRVRYPGGLIANGDFEGETTEPWFVNFGDNTVPLETNATNTYFIVNIESANAAEPYLVNLSQIVEIERGKNYVLSFDASSDVERSFIAGIGLNGGSFASNTQNVSITTETVRYEFQLAANFGEDGVDNRVLFDFAGETGVVVLDNIKLEEVETTSVPPTEAPAAPTEAAGDVISIYSDSYDDVANNGFNNYGAATFAEVDLGGNSVLQYTQSTADGGNFQVIELGDANKFDASGMTNFRFDAWFSNEIGTGASFIMKVVNIDGDPNEEAIITIDAASNPGLAQGEWLSYDFSMTELQNLGLTTNTAIQQIVIDVINVGEVYLDNIYFYNDGGGSGNGGGSGAQLFLEEFNAASSADSWSKIADAAANDNVTVTYSETGGVDGSGAIELAFTSTAAGAYILRYQTTADYAGNGSVTISYQAKVVTAITGAAFHMQSQVPADGGGVVTTDTFDTQNQINDSGFTTITQTVTGLGDGDVFIVDFNFAAGGEAGGAVLIDNIKIEAAQ